MNEAASAFATVWLTYLMRSLVASAIFWLICRLIRDPQLRFQMCTVFLGMMVLAWFGLLAQPGPPAVAMPQSTATSTASSFPWLWTLHLALPPFLVLSRAWWIYLTLLTPLLLQFGVRFGKLRILLSASEPPSEALQARFESVRSNIGVSTCDLRLVPELRSPAATGWWRPTVLLPCDLVPRLETRQLEDVLRHELMHVRRRDYLWDGLATLSCYLLFFHPSVWLVRRRLRWERELVCDEGVVESGGVRRLEYATCLTTVASWRWLPGAEPRTSIDFLSSTSLLTTRVRALTSPAGAHYSKRKKAVVGLSAGAALVAAAWVAPEVAVTCAWSAPRSAAVLEESPQRPQPELTPQPLNQERPPLMAGRPAPRRRHRTPAREIIAPDQYSRLIPLRPIPSPSSASTASISPPSSQLILPASGKIQSQERAARQPMRRGLVQRVGTWTAHTVKFGVARLGSIGGRHPSGSSGTQPDSAPDNSTNPL